MAGLIFSVVFSAVSLAVSILALRINRDNFKTRMQNHAFISNENHMIEIESRIGQNPELLRFHGIEDPDAFLKECDLTPAEFAYLLNSFTTGSIFYNTAIDEKKKTILKPNSYRWIMCKSEATKKAWPAVKMLLVENEYRDELERIIYSE